MAVLTWTETKKIDKGPSKGKVIEWQATDLSGTMFTVKPPFGRRRYAVLTKKFGATPETVWSFTTADEAKAAAEAA